MALRNPEAWSVAALVVVVVGCASSPEPIWSSTFHDATGRECTNTCTPLTCSFTCQTPSQPQSCSEGQRACDALESFPHETHPAQGVRDVLMLCASCCDGPRAVFDESACSPVVCEKDIDCVLLSMECRDGVCSCEGERCGARPNVEAGADSPQDSTTDVAAEAPAD